MSSLKCGRTNTRFGTVLFCGEDKSTQEKDIRRARDYLADYRRRENDERIIYALLIDMLKDKERALAYLNAAPFPSGAARVSNQFGSARNSNRRWSTTTQRKSTLPSPSG